MLDQLTRGRMMFGFGPGGNPIDAGMLGMDPNEQRRMMEESMEAMLALLALDGPVTRKTDWFVLENAELQVAPYTKPRFEIGVRLLGSPAGARLAGQYGLSLLSIGATTPNGLRVPGHGVGDRLRAGRAPRQHHGPGEPGGSRSPCTWPRPRRRPGRQTRYGFNKWLEQYGPARAGHDAEGPSTRADIDRRSTGSTSRASASSARPRWRSTRSGACRTAAPGFGALLLTNFGWSVPDAKYDFDSLEVVARRVMPVFQDHLDAPMRAFGKLAGALGRGPGGPDPLEAEGGGRPGRRGGGPPLAPGPGPWFPGAMDDDVRERLERIEARLEELAGAILGRPASGDPPAEAPPVAAEPDTGGTPAEGTAPAACRPRVLMRRHRRHRLPPGTGDQCVAERCMHRASRSPMPTG